MALQKYAKERIHFEQSGEYLVLKIPDLSEQRPSLILGDTIIVTDPPNCTKRLGKFNAYEFVSISSFFKIFAFIPHNWRVSYFYSCPSFANI